MAIRHQFTIICDDIRQENTGKLILIGVYTPSIAVPHVPTAMQSLAFFQSWESDRPGRFNIRMRIEQMETGRPIVEGMGMMQIMRPGQGISVMKFGNFQIPAFGTYNFIVNIEGEPDPIISSFDVVLPPQQLTQQAQLPFRG